jgi:hypothetical protein
MNKIFNHKIKMAEIQKREVTLENIYRKVNFLHGKCYFKQKTIVSKFENILSNFVIFLDSSDKEVNNCQLLGKGKFSNNSAYLQL